ncbi:2286_t:CDS:2 [Gigaspora margarita]|uniref:2286_t:CDS:1 n=1 Tax=Gigaspora margarita TaxID=4874 RepID=A0ABN7UKY2_GIGMA|nr:2286_t:CDS:2 [Gigaspora margarita]
MFNNSPSFQSQESDSENSIEQNINLEALQKSASDVFQVQYTSIQEFSKGGFHKVYILRMEDGKEYIGRVVFPGPFNTTQENILDVIRNLIRYYKSKDTQKCLIPKYEKLYKLVPKYFQDDGNDTFVLTHGDFHSSNILVKNDEISGIIDWECFGSFPIEFCTYLIWITEKPELNEVAKDNQILIKFFRDEMTCRDSNFIHIIDNINEEKKAFYSAVFNQDVCKIDDFLDKYKK